MTTQSNTTQSNTTNNALQNNARRINPDTEDAYWQSQYQNENYYEAGSKYDDYRSAYRTGYEGYGRYGDRKFDEVENDLRNDWERAKGNTQMAGDKAKHAVKAAWHRVERAMPGDADNDRR
jgi:hypothetical protein